MAFTLDTNHALYGNLVELIGVDPATQQLASCKTARTFTAAGSPTYPGSAGTYGKCAKVTPGNSFTFSPWIVFSNEAATVVVVINNCAVSGVGEVRQLCSTTRERTPMIQLDDVGHAIVGREYAVPSPGLAVGTSVVTGGSHVLAVTHGASGTQVYVDGVLEGSNSTVLDLRTDCNLQSIGGVPGFNGVNAEIVWLAVFNKVLSGAEIATLTTSVGANNVIGLLDGAPAGGTPTVSSVTVSPGSATVAGLGQQTFTATVAGTNNPGQGVNWSATGGGSITSGGVFTAPAAGASPQTITITARSQVDTSKSGTATVTVPATGAQNPTVTSVTVSPNNVTVNGLGQQQYTATVIGTNNPSQSVTWSTTHGSISAGGLWTAPAAGVTPTTVTITATHSVDNTKSGSVVATVSPAAGAGQFLFDSCINNTGQAVSNVTLRWSWYPGGRIGALAGITPIEGIGNPATGLPAGPGCGFVTQWMTGPVSDLCFYQAGTVS